MSLTQTIAYANPGNFSFDTAKIQVSGGKASLKLIPNPAQEFAQDFTSDAGFTYDDDLAEFTGGTLRQLAQRPAGATFAAKFNLTTDASWGNGSLEATETGSPVITGGKLDLSGGGKFVTFDGVDNVQALGMVGCFNLRYTPNYDGTPSANQVMIDLYDSANSGRDRITLLHLGNGSFFLLMNDSDGNNQLSNSVAPYNAQAGVEVELELSWDLNAQLVRIFGEGFLVAEIPAAFVRTDTIDTIQIGDTSSDFFERDLVFFNAVQHTANYTAHEYVLPNADYVESTATLPAFAYTDPGAIQAFTAFAATITGAPRFLLNGRYWSGSAWVISDGTYAQSTTRADAIANIATLTPTAPLTVKVVFGDGNTLGIVDDLGVTYTGQIYPTDDPSIEPGTGIDLDGLDGFSTVEGGTGAIRFQLRLSGTLYYWTGSAWSTSDGSYAQANTAAEVHANRAHASLVSVLNDGQTLRLRALLHSDTGQATPELTSATISYDFFASVPTAPAECTVFGFVRNILGDTLATAPVLVVTLEAAFFSGAYLILPFRQEIPADDDGRFEVSLIETFTVAKKYLFEVQYENANGVTQSASLGNATVPNATDANLSTLTYTAA